MISIAMAYKNRKKLLIRTLESIFKSSYTNFEIVIVDDGSSDDQRIEDIVNQFNIKLIRIEPEEKNWINPCVPYNIAFKHCTGNIVIIQNPECYHVGDILNYVSKNLQNDQYFTFGCYSVDLENTEKIFNNLFIEYINIDTKNKYTNCWFNHSIYNPSNLHFCSAIYKTQLDELSGFDERYSHGYEFDDNEFLYRIKNKKLNIKIIDDPFVIHLWHYSESIYNNPNVLTLRSINSNIFNYITTQTDTYKANYWVMPRVPKVMNFFWDGSPMSYLNYLTIISFHKFNPDWKINIYVSSITNNQKTWNTEEHQTAYQNIDYFQYLFKINYVNIINFNFEDIGIDNNTPSIFKSDFLRWYLLGNNGGGWSDFDILYFRSLNNLIIDGNMIQGDSAETEMAIFHDPYYICFYLSAANNLFFKNIFEKSKHRLNTSIYQSVGSFLISELYPDLNSIMLSHPNMHFTKLPNHTLYPYPWSERNNLFNANCQIDEIYASSKFKKDTIGIHWWNGTPVAKEYVNYFNRENISNSNNILANLIKLHNLQLSDYIV